MFRSRRRRLGIEWLEARNMLAATASVLSGSLMISGSGNTNLQIDQTAANTWTVLDGGSPVGAGTFSGVTGNIIIQSNGGNDTVVVDQHSRTAPKSIQLSLGDGTNQFTLQNGFVRQNVTYAGGTGNDTINITNQSVSGSVVADTGNGTNSFTMAKALIAGAVAVGTGDGDDQVTLGDGVNNVAIAAGVLVSDRGGANDVLTVTNKTAVRFSITTYAINQVNLNTGSYLAGSLAVSGGYNVANSLNVDAAIDGQVIFVGSGGVDNVQFGVNTVVGKTVLVNLADGNDIATFDGKYKSTFNLIGGAGDDTINLGGTISSIAALTLGNGNDFLSVTARIGPTTPTLSQMLYVDAGNDNDQVAIRASANITGKVKVLMGAGDDAFSLDDAAFVVGANIDGGAGTDTYYGTRPRLNVIDALFEAFLAGPPPF